MLNLEGNAPHLWERPRVEKGGTLLRTPCNHLPLCCFQTLLKAQCGAKGMAQRVFSKHEDLRSIFSTSVKSHAWLCLDLEPQLCGE